MPAENADDTGAAESSQPPLDDLPTRPSRHKVLRRIRCMDDPEILQQVLEGLINLT